MEVKELMKLIDEGKLSVQDNLYITSKLIGYTAMPPTIEEFVNDDYYLGKVFGKFLFKHWKNFLKKLFPDPIHQPYPYVCLTGALGAGKSTIAKVAEMYIDCKMDHLYDFSFASLADTKPIVASFFHTNRAKAQQEFVDSIKGMRQRSPYFTMGKLGGVQVGLGTDGQRGNSSIGEDVIFYNMSELNFVKRSIAQAKITQAHMRNKSRYQKILGYFPMIILDSSADADNSVVDEFINNNPFEGVAVDRSAIWEAKEGLGIYFNKGSFKLYKGDSQSRPHIIEEGEDESKLDKDRIVICPKEVEPDFRSNLIQAMRDIGGMSVSASENFIEDTSAIDRQCSLHDYIPNPIYVEFSDLKDDIMSKVDYAIDLLPKDKIIFIGLDAGITNDLYSIAMGYVDRMFEVPTKVEDKWNKIYYPVVQMPVVFGISRYATEYTSITHIYQFILAVRDRGYEVGAVTCDQYQSTQLIQDINRSGIRCYKISTDRTDVPSGKFKDAMYRGLIFMPDSPILKAELKRLKRVDGKIDASREEVNGITTHKDFSDAVIRCYNSILDNVDLATEVPSNAAMDTQIESTKKLLDNSNANSAQKTISNMLESIYQF
jgi:hypothetical protein